MERMTTRPARILVMDDDESVLDVTCEDAEGVRLRGRGHRYWRQGRSNCTTVHDRRLPFDIVIMDLTVPMELGGDEAVRELRSSDPEAQVIVSTGLGDR